MSTQVIAERKLLIEGIGGESVLVKLFLPQRQSEADDFECTYQIVLPDQTIMRTIFGLDAFQAIDLATHMIGSELQLIEGKRKWTFRFGGGDAGFPRFHDGASEAREGSSAAA